MGNELGKAKRAAQLDSDTELHACPAYVKPQLTQTQKEFLEDEYLCGMCETAIDLEYHFLPGDELLEEHKNCPRCGITRARSRHIKH